ncbi:hypothetical protein NLI96_g1873 [Meripilus lineatus]|uniref:Uncharacterized protein n=1 Tax=Meripilus lineatus TaxID=2056292 RepID=A0AAD5VBB2_9APHY|nr:hypothetical protein NLI96_g1873 [Physisporinus lineatus]
MLKFILTQGSLYIRLIHDDPQYFIPVPFTALLKFQHQTNLLHPSFDLSHLVEIRTTIDPHSEYILEEMDTISSMWKHDELIDLDNLERLQIGIHLDDDNPFGKPQMELMDYLKEHVKEEEVDSASDTLDKLERRFETLRDCDRRYELEITVDGSPIDDVLREWKTKIVAVEKEEGAKEDGGAEEREGGAEGAGEGTEGGSDWFWTDSEFESYPLLSGTTTMIPYSYIHGS